MYKYNKQTLATFDSNKTQNNKYVNNNWYLYNNVIANLYLKRLTFQENMEKM